MNAIWLWTKPQQLQILSKRVSHDRTLTASLARGMVLSETQVHRLLSLVKKTYTLRLTVMFLRFQSSLGTKSGRTCHVPSAEQRKPSLGSRVLMIGDEGGDLAAYAPDTGRSGATMKAARSPRHPAITSGIVYITNGTDVVALEASTGSPIWRFTSKDFSPITNTSAVLGSTVYALAATQCSRSTEPPDIDSGVPISAHNTTSRLLQ
jgi:PQQ-like domain